MVPMDVIELGNGRGHPRDPLRMDEEARLSSSDLEDCREVWGPELDDYILETKKRQNQVASYFWASRLVSMRVTSSVSHLTSSAVGAQQEHSTGTGPFVSYQDCCNPFACRFPACPCPPVTL